MLDHVGFAVADAERSRRFYEAALAPLGIALIMTRRRPEQTEAAAPPTASARTASPISGSATMSRWGRAPMSPSPPRRRAQVDAFYEAALAAGGRDNGAPGLQAALSSRIITAPSCSIPTGSNIEAVCHRPE